MSYADDFWLGATAMQRNVQQMLSFNAAFYSTAAVQAWKLGIDAPMIFWQAMSRAGDIPAHVKASTKPKAAAPVAAVEPTPEPAAQMNPHLLDAPRGGAADDLTVLSGVAAKLQTSLNELGLYHFDQLAGLDDDGVAWLNEQLPGFKALVSRFKIVAQAKDKAA